MPTALPWTEPLAIACLAVSVLTLGLSAYLVYKLRQVHVTLYGADFVARRISADVTRTLQDIDLLRHELALDRPLPQLRGWVASPDVLLLLARHVRRHCPTTIVECGSGVSTIVHARAAQLNGHGHVYAIDHDPAFAEQTRQALYEFGLVDWATVTHAPLTTIEVGGVRAEWYDPERLPEVATIDLLFVDGPPADTPKPIARYPAGRLLFPRLSADAAVFVDDAARPGEVEMLRRWAAEFPELGQHRHPCEKGCVELRAAASTRCGPAWRTGKPAAAQAAMAAART